LSGLENNKLYEVIFIFGIGKMSGVDSLIHIRLENGIHEIEIGK